MDPIDTMANLRAKQNQGRKWTGIDARNTKIADMLRLLMLLNQLQLKNKL